MDWDLIRQKSFTKFVQIVQTAMCAKEKPLTAVCVYILFYGNGTGTDNGTGYSGFS